MRFEPGSGKIKATVRAFDGRVLGDLLIKLTTQLDEHSTDGRLDVGTFLEVIGDKGRPADKSEIKDLDPLMEMVWDVVEMLCNFPVPEALSPESEAALEAFSKSQAAFARMIMREMINATEVVSEYDIPNPHDN